MIRLIEQRLRERQGDVDAWLATIWKDCGVPFYASADIRNAHFKVSVIDTNLFPAGFNNLCSTVRDAASDAVRDYLLRCAGNPRSVLLITEMHTRNLYYLENVVALQGILQKAGVEVVCGTWGLPDGSKQMSFDLPSGQKLLLRQICRKDVNVLACGETVPDVVISNNDFSNGIPEPLQGVRQPILPPPQLGWYQRRKSDHFVYYKDTVTELARILDLDPWLFYPLTELQGGIDFQAQEGLEALAATVDRVISQIREQYARYHITETPYVFIKNNRGTYGLGIMTARRGDEVLTLNRKQRNNMAYSKSKKAVDEVIVQEGIPTYERVKDQAAEPVMMSIGSRVIGGFLRFHSEQNDQENLNSPGMAFERLCLTECVSEDRRGQLCVVDRCRDTVYSCLTLAAVAASSREMKAVLAKPEQIHV